MPMRISRGAHAEAVSALRGHPTGGGGAAVYMGESERVGDELVYIDASPTGKRHHRIHYLLYHIYDL
jgi:hypothetical protein